MRNDRGNHSRPGMVLLMVGLIPSAATCFAHPMGNFSINHYSKIRIGQGSIEIRYLIDMAEIPTFQETRQFSIAPSPNDPGVSRYLDRQDQILKEGISLESDGQAVRLDTVSRQVEFAEGTVWVPSRKNLEETVLRNVLPPSAEMLRLMELYRKGVDGLIAELNKP